MTIVTESGSVYHLTANSRGILVADKKGSTMDPQPVIAVYKDRLPMLEDTVRVVREGVYTCGYNARGACTLRLIPTQIRRGMILANRRGLRSTPIAEIHGATRVRTS